MANPLTRFARPAGAVIPPAPVVDPTPPAPAPAPTPPPSELAPSTPAAPAAPDATGDIDANGRLVGVDGILDQIGEALRRQIEPVLTNTILPIISRDQELQKAVGHAAGQSIAETWQPWAIVAAGALATMAVVAVAREMRHRKGRRSKGEV